jgi:chromate transporter
MNPESGATASADLVAARSASIFEIFTTALKLGCTSFGGPIAHLGYFRETYVRRLQWLDEATYADLVALAQFLPGPASSQVGIGVGSLRAGPIGGLAAWLGFTLPSAIGMTAFALLLDRYDVSNAGWIHGLKIVAVAVVAQAVWGMGCQFCTGIRRLAIAVAALVVLLIVTNAAIQIAVIVAAGLIGWRFLAGSVVPAAPATHPHPVSRRAGITALVLFGALLLLLPLLGRDSNGTPGLIYVFYRAGSLVFGGGHAVLPLLQRDVVPNHWVTNAQFLSGYGAAQAVPGPLFTFAAFLGAERDPGPNGVAGAALATGSIFLPSFLLIYGALPFWHALRGSHQFRSALAGINASVVGILAAALYSPVWTGSIDHLADALLAGLCLVLLMYWKRPSWQVVIAGALGGQLLAWFT